MIKFGYSIFVMLSRNLSIKYESRRDSPFSWYKFGVKMRQIILFTLFFGLAFADIPEIWLEGDVQEPKIIQGQDANEGEFPFMASLRKRNAAPGHSCGASIITSKWALSAAHCCASIQNTDDWYLYAGSIFLSRGGSKHSIEKAVIHHDYMPDLNWRNDICLIKVSQPFVFGKNVDQITLASSDWVVSNGSKVTISGWGRTRPDSGIPDRLQKGVNFTALSNEECKRVCGLDIYGGYLCACGTRKEQCTWNGDSGGPLTHAGAQVGLVSFGYRPYGTGRPTVYSRVTYYIDWIKKTLGAEASQLKIRQQKEVM